MRRVRDRSYGVQPVCVSPIGPVPAGCRLGSECVRDDAGCTQETAGMGCCTSKTTARGIMRYRKLENGACYTISCTNFRTQCVAIGNSAESGSALVYIHVYMYTTAGGTSTVVACVIKL